MTDEKKPRKKRIPKSMIVEEPVFKIGKDFNKDTDVDAAVLREREECAKIADRFLQQDSFDTVTRVTSSVAREIGNLIRNRK